MEKSLEQILRFESENIHHIYLFSSPDGCFWDAYEQSAVNIQQIIPEVRGAVEKMVFKQVGLWLRHVRINEALVLKYSLPLYCTLLGDDYAELTLPDRVFCECSDVFFDVHDNTAVTSAIPVVAE